MARGPNALNLFAKLRRLPNWRLEHKDGEWWCCTIKAWDIEVTGCGGTMTEAIDGALWKYDACEAAIAEQRG